MPARKLNDEGGRDPGATAVAGTVSYTATGSVGSFAPTAILAYNTTYTATITTAVTNTVGVRPAAVPSPETAEPPQ